jgi:ER lumen protein retaining receptor
MKIFFIASSVAIVYFIRYKYKATYDREHDTFRVVFLVAPCAVLALLINMEFTIMEVTEGSFGWMLTQYL